MSLSSTWINFSKGFPSFTAFGVQFSTRTHFCFCVLVHICACLRMHVNICMCICEGQDPASGVITQGQKSNLLIFLRPGLSLASYTRQAAIHQAPEILLSPHCWDYSAGDHTWLLFRGLCGLSSGACGTSTLYQPSCCLRLTCIYLYFTLARTFDSTDAYHH